MSNSTAVSIFQFKSHDVRSLLIDGEPWFVAKDICDILELAWKGSETLSILDDDEKGVRKLRTPGGEQETIIISESGLYTLIIRSNKPQARKFRKWVTSEVLPAIRKTGQYREPVAQGAPLLLQNEIREGASLLAQVIGREQLSEHERWQLVDKLFFELFGRSVSMLADCRESNPRAAGYCGPELVVMLRREERGQAWLALPYSIYRAFLDAACTRDAALACSLRSLYACFNQWWQAWCGPGCAIGLDLFAAALPWRTITLLGEPWVLGLEPRRPAVLNSGSMEVAA